MAAEQTPAIRDVSLHVATAKATDGVTYPVLQIGMLIEAGRATEVGAALMQALATADAAARTANQAPGLVLPDTVGGLYVPAPSNGHAHPPD
jgi:ribose 5-phosphate isomerase RpiB